MGALSREARIQVAGGGDRAHLGRGIVQGLGLGIGRRAQGAPVRLIVRAVAPARGQGKAGGKEALWMFLPVREARVIERSAVGDVVQHARRDQGERVRVDRLAGVAAFQSSPLSSRNESYCDSRSFQSCIIDTRSG